MAVVKKETLCELRSHYAFSTLIAFAITTLSCISISVGGVRITNRLLAALLWVILFFSAMAGLSRVFVQEQDAGTITTLRVYALPQGVFWGKLIFNVLLLVGISVIILPLFFVFFSVSAGNLPALVGVICLGACGIGVISTVTAAMAANSQGRSALFTILTFPLVLPVFFSAIPLTDAILAGAALSNVHFFFLIGYILITAVAGSILFDYLWMD